MQNQQTPQVLAQPFCAQGDKNTIPNAATGSNLASLQEGFPPITGLPVSQGGIPPERQDFNGVMNLNSQFYFAFQNGWWPTFSQDVSDAIGGYPQNAILCYFVPESNSVQFVRSLIPNNTYNFVTTPSYIGQYWVKCLMESAGLPMGAVYYSQSALTTDNPGAVPAWQGVFEQNGSQTYPEFFTWITSHTELCITKTEYDSDITTYGECPFYVLNETSAGNLRFPQLVNYIKNANSTDGITQSAAGLPNITGTFATFDTARYIKETSGAFSSSTSTSTNSGLWNEAGTGNGAIAFNASDSNSIYGSADTVTPANTTLYPWIVVNPSATSISQCVLLSQVGVANGVASLDANTRVPFEQMPSKVVDNIDIPFDPSTYGWPDIRPAARPNAVVLLAGVKSDYSAYDNLGFKATCTGGYNVFIDGVQYGQTYASAAQCSITWSQYPATTGFSVTQPEALTAHIVQIVPAVAGNNITEFQMVRVAASGAEAQGLLWLHLTTQTALPFGSVSVSGQYSNNLLKAISSVQNSLKIGNSNNTFYGTAGLAYLPECDMAESINPGILSFVVDSALKKITLANRKVTGSLYRAFAGCVKLEEIILKNASLCPSEIHQTFTNCQALKRLPPIDFSQVTSAYQFLYNGYNLKDLVLDLSYANLLQVFQLYNTPGLKGLIVSPQAPFDYTTAPQINVSNTGLDTNALVALFNSLPTVTAGQVINITGATGAASLTAEQLAIATNKGWTVTR